MTDPAPSAAAACLLGERNGFRWYHVDDPRGPALDELAAQFGLHELAIEDCRNHRQRAKLEEYEGHLFIIFNSIHFNPEKQECWFREIDFFVGKDFLISVREGPTPSRTVAAVLPKFRSDPKMAHPGRLLQSMLDFMVDQYLPVLDTVEDRIEQIEEQVLENPTPQLLSDIFSLRRALIDFRRVALAGREVINHLLYRTEPWFRSQQPYFRNIYDHIVRALDFAETYRDILTGVLDVHLSATANRTNEIMKRLTFWATVALPFLLITGFFGMNFSNLPWLENSLGWIYASLAMIAAGVVMGAYFKYRGWF